MAYRRCTNNISRRFTYRDHCSFIWIRIYITAIAIGCNGNPFFSSFHEQNCSIRRLVGRTIHRPYHTIVLLIDPSFGSDRRKADQLFSDCFQMQRNLYGFRIKFFDLRKITGFCIVSFILRRTSAKNKFIGRKFGFQGLHAYKIQGCHPRLLRQSQSKEDPIFQKLSSLLLPVLFQQRATSAPGFHSIVIPMLSCLPTCSISCIYGRVGTLSRSIRIPTPPLALISEVEQMIPAAPISCMPTTAPV